jgi:hypothetical protein
VEEQKVPLPLPEKSDEYAGELLIESAVGSDLLALTEIMARDTEMPPLLGPTSLEPPDFVLATDAVFEDRVEIMWSRVELDAIVYMIRRNGELLALASSQDSLFADRTGVPAQIYSYCVQVTDMAGEESDSTCDEGSRIIFPPEDVWASDGQFDQFVRVTWDDMSSVEAGYFIRRNGADIDTTIPNAVMFDDAAAVPETTYEYQVIAFDADDNWATPVADSGFRGVVLPPLEVWASDGEYPDFVRITWIDQAENEGGYNIYRRSDPDSAYDPIGSTPDTVYTFDDFTADYGVTYDYCVATEDTLSKESIKVCDSGGRGILPAPAWVRASDSTFDDCVQITWDDPSDLEDGFVILRDGALLDTTRANVTIYKDVRADPDSWYRYCVTAFNDSGGRSDSVCDDGYRAVVLPPFDVQATDGTHEDRVEVTWESSSTTAALFKILRNNTFIKSVSKGSRSYSDYGGTAAVDYDYSVMAVTEQGIQSDTVSDTGRRDLKAPTQVKASYEEYEEKIVISWQDNSWVENGYQVSRMDSVFGTLTGWWELGPNRTSYTDYTARAGRTQIYSVAAWDSSGIEEWWGFSPPGEDFGLRVLLAPSNVRATDGKFEKRVEITWEDNSNAEDGYHIYRDSVIIDSTPDNFTSYVDTLPVFAQMSEYSVTAFDSYGESEAVSDTGFTTILAPGSFNASDVYENRVELTWVDLSEVETGYLITGDHPRYGVWCYLAGADTTSFTDTWALPGVTYRYCIQAVCDDNHSAMVCDEGRRFSRSETQIKELDLKLLAGDAQARDWFGASVAVDSQVAIVGAHGDSSGRGSAYIFTRAGDGSWTESKKLTLSISHPGYHFGYSVGLDGDFAIVGAPYGWGWDLETGAAHIFERDAEGNWEEKQNLGYLLDTLSRRDRFGISVAISGGVAIVGADGWGSFRGRAYIFERGADGTWTKKASIQSTYDESFHCFGSSVAIDGSVAIVGGPGWYQNRGSAYIFQRGRDGTWPDNETQRLEARDAAPHDHFGRSVAIDGDVAIVGAPDHDTHSGAAYIFRRAADDTWPRNETRKLLQGDAGNGSAGFGYAVDVDGDVAVIGAPRDNDWTWRGSAYIFRRAADTWAEQKKILASDGVAGDGFGLSLATHDGVAFIGAPLDDDTTGSAYVIEFVVPPGGVAATDGSLNSRVRVQWEDRSSAEGGFNIYRDGEHIARVLPDIETYEDFEAQPGRTHEYGVEVFSESLPSLEPLCDLGWRPPNGNITGRVSTTAGAGVERISVGLDPQPIRALLLDGTGGHVCIPDPDGTFNFGTWGAGSYTIEAWIKYSTHGAGFDLRNQMIIAKGGPERFPFLLSNLHGEEQPGRLEFRVSDGNAWWHVVSQRADLNDDTWHHVACVHDTAQDRFWFYVDGIVEGNTSHGIMGKTANSDDLTLGVGYGPDSWFGGQIDEVRIWNVARTTEEIQATMRQQLTGDEEGLVVYWPLDGGAPDVITDLTSGAHYGFFQDGVYWTDNAAPIEVSTMTDLEGNYALSRVRYGQETTFEVRPFGEQRQFQPAFKFITLSTGHPVENQVDFVETTSFTVCGLVRFESADCFEQNVQIYVDGQVRAVTDKNGKFSVAESKGGHCFKPFLAGHTFDPDSACLTIGRDTSGVNFTDLTRRKVQGTVSGGCDIAIGWVTITFRSENDCMVKTVPMDTASSMYQIELPPQRYLVKAELDSIAPAMEKLELDLMKFFKNLGERVVDLSGSDTTLDFIYRAPLQVTIEGLEGYVPGDCPEGLTFRGRKLPHPLPVIPHREVLSLTIYVNENYGGGNLCPLDSGSVIIYDEIADREDSLIEVPVLNGVANYQSFACTPSLVVGRVDSEGNDRSFQKAIHATVIVEGKTPVTATEWALVKGHVAPEGADFVTATSGPVPLYILRDPPGDNSYAYLEGSSSVRTTIEYGDSITNKGSGTKGHFRFGVDQTFNVGIGVGTSTPFHAMIGADGGTLTGTVTHKQWRTEATVTTKKTFSTSPSELFVGEGGDMFIGAGWNFLFGVVGVVEVEECEVIRSTSLAFQPDSLKTVFAYSQQYIEDVLIPELEAMIQYCDQEGETGKALRYQQVRDDWKNMLAENEQLKDEVRQREDDKENRSFSAGADFAYSHEQNKTESYCRTVTAWFESSAELTVADVKFSGVEAAIVLIPMIFHAEWIEEYEDTTGDTSLAVGYVLSDDDIGDHFTVDVGSDGRYPSPVFDVRAGVSSCPYEPWPDPDGKARMMPRDKPQLLISPNRLDGVPPDEVATFTLNLCNLSPTEEIREYVLREVTTSNPGGAIIKANGNFIGNGLSYFIDGDPLSNSNEVTLTVGRGPSRYNYPNLALMLYAPCEYSLWEQGAPLLQRSDTLYFTVNFKAPCSDITLFDPEPGWIFNREMQIAEDSLRLMLTDYDLEISEKHDSLEAIGAQYRHLGIGREGPGEWVSLPEVTLSNIDKTKTFTNIPWLPGDPLEDGVYELRAFTRCKDGWGYSNVAVGTIDRNAPQVFGTPQPADGELSLGEEISITFNEPIDCGSISPDSLTLKYLDGPNPDTPIDANWVCDGSTIIITPAGDDPGALEGRLVKASLEGVCDLVGNRMEEEDITWTFTVRQSAFTWSQGSIIRDVPFRTPGSITAELVNGCDSIVDFNIPPPDPESWITAVSPSTGSLEAGGKQRISFAIKEDLAMGSYDSVIVAQAGDVGAELDLHLTVSCHQPVWEMDPGRYENTMTITAEVNIEGTFSSDTNDQVAAFVGNQLRGLANLKPTAGPHEAFLTVHSNRKSGETVRFEVWDDSECKLYNSTLERFAFKIDTSYGSPNNPVTLTAVDVLPETVQEIPLAQGWNWFSTYVLSVDMSVNGVLSDLTPAEGDIIKSDTAFATFDPDEGWVGTLPLLDNVHSCMIRLSEEGTILQEGSVVDPVTTSIPVSDGWNWIGYLPTGPMTVETALQGLNSFLSEGDVVKSQTAFAQISPSGWSGSLESMEPGRGYKLYLKTAPGSFNYPGGGGLAPTWVGNPEQEANRKVETSEADPGWSLNRHAYQYNMTAIAALNLEGNECRDEDHIIGAFVDGECRGIGRPIYLSTINRSVAFLMIHSNEIAGERVEFQAFVPEARAVYNVAEAISYEADRSVGTIREPLILSTEGVAFEVTENVPAAFSLSQNYPNPFNPMTTIEYSLPEQSHVMLEIFNILGQRVSTLVSVSQPAGRHRIVWDGKDDQGKDVASGIYFYRLEAGEFTDSKRMVILK